MTGAGSLNRIVTLQRAMITKNAFNEDIETWATIAKVVAEKRDVSAGESYRAHEVGAEITARFRLRYNSMVSGLNPRDRLTFRGKTYNITAVREVQRNRWIEVDAVERRDIAAIEASP